MARQCMMHRCMLKEDSMEQEDTMQQRWRLMNNAFVLRSYVRQQGVVAPIPKLLVTQCVTCL